MNISTAQTGKSGRKSMGLAMVLVLASALGAMAATPALARDDHGRRGGHDRGHDHDHGGFGVGIYSDPVYVPAPVYYDPQPSPGISIALPLNIHIR